MTVATIVSSEKLKEDVENLLKADNRVDERNITVRVMDDTVHLSGTVPDYADRRIAESDAAIVPGVSGVDNHLSVQHPEEWEPPPDPVIRANVARSLRWDSGIDLSGIRLSVNKGVVLLDGRVSSYWQKFRVQELAQNIAGVIDVDNNLAIEPVKEFSDNVINEDVVMELGRNLRVSGERIHVTVENGIVTLDGDVPDLSTYRAAETISFYVSGVIDVKNNLFVQPVSE